MLLLPLLWLAGTQYIMTCVCVRPSSSSAMEKGVLLVLLCLSFLLITAFTAADAAALVEENRRQPPRLNLVGRPAAGLLFIYS